MLKISFSRQLVRTFATTADEVTIPKLTDILIVGGGPAGLTLATAIKNSSHLAKLKTTLVDSAKLTENVLPFYSNPPTEYHNRVVSITPKSLNFITNTLNVKLLENRIQPYDGCYITDGISKAHMSLNKESMLYMVEIMNIQSSLLKHLKELNLKEEDFEMKENVKVENISYSNPEDPTSWPLVKLSNGETYKTRLLIGCDGANSPVKKFSKLNTEGWKYNTFGTVATLKLNGPPIFKINGWQRFLKWGPVAHLPLPDNNASLVWSTKGNTLSEMFVNMDTKVFASLINAAFVLSDADLEYYFNAIKNNTMKSDELIDDINFRINETWDNLKDDSLIDEIFPPQVVDVVKGSVARFPFKFSHVDKYVTDRIALVGDAAHTTHPLAGQGLNMGQHDVEELTKALEKATLRGLDIGSELALEPYWAECYPFNNVRLGLADKLHKLYQTDSKPIVAMRSLGLTLTDKIEPVKNLVIDTLTGGEEMCK
ncbi:hypothetical protein KAFR_0F04240 [Kazachstania africana CBS 2517]|uniref:Ubiquinone biosynthesis monooxygenase COQ6, mitochondrial n=1 Tax=Kazachstania africana (strain ATCC 22294 / BCRC 22015 / CBS 2517 / CECT 1963 / NBRC 1671 / NRRL Y-8276) TaxID=1071382 RepID=H2AXB9_KAZAF|nr:hypothetical protein KAFR_0F04240 [Kazachstania africana CBS 2517]CCF59019.1 hypothetical protein KAFR_0F04240 [Kazachstania africana CBS 2517]